MPDAPGPINPAMLGLSPHASQAGGSAGGRSQGGPGSVRSDGSERLASIYDEGERMSRDGERASQGGAPDWSENLSVHSSYAGSDAGADAGEY